ncbi:MAG: SLC13 family permease [Vicinamibacterales bacterium]
MTPAHASLAALVVAIVLSCTSRINVGLLALPLAWAVGIYAGQGGLPIAEFPASLFITLAGVTLLFALSEVNGTVEALARMALGLARGSARAVPIIFFLIACALSTVGPGAIASVALVVPMAMAVGRRAGIPPFLTALMVANGANAGNLSPISSVGVIANTSMAGVGLGGHEGKVWAANFVAHLLVGIAAYILLGGYRLSGDASTIADEEQPEAPAWTGARRMTVAIIAAWIVAVVLGGASLGLSAFTAAVALVLTGAADEKAGIARMPWSAIVMVTGMSVLVGVVETTGGMELFTSLLASLASPGTLNGTIAFVTGVISSYSSTSGVVLPTFLPTVPGLVSQVGGGDPLAVALSINVGSSLVDVSPLSTLGALAVAALADPASARDLFRKLMIWGLSMTLVGAALAQLLAGPFAAL